MTFIFKYLKFQSPTTKQSVTPPINANKSGIKSETMAIIGS